MKIQFKNRSRAFLNVLIIGCTLNGVAATNAIADEQPTFGNEQQPTFGNEQQPSVHEGNKPDSKKHHGKKRRGDNHPRLRGPMVIIDQLDIEPKQRALAQQIITEQHQKRMSIHQQARQNHQNQRQKMREVHLQTIDRLSTVLSTEQLQQFEQLLEQNRPARPPRRDKGNRRDGNKESFKASHQ